MLITSEDFFVGIDLSLAGSGIVIINENGELVEQKLVVTYKDCYLSPEQRVMDIFDQTKFVVNITRLKFVCIEGLSYMSVSQTLFERCGLLYMILIHLLKHEIDYLLIPPKTLKKFVTTDGNADKVFIRRVIKCRWGYDFEDDNIADAYGLARMALERIKSKGVGNQIK